MRDERETAPLRRIRRRRLRGRAAGAVSVDPELPPGPSKPRRPVTPPGRVDRAVDHRPRRGPVAVAVRRCPGPVSPERGRGRGPAGGARPADDDRGPVDRPPSAAVAAVCDPPGRCSVPGAARLELARRVLAEGLAEVCGIDPRRPRRACPPTAARPAVAGWTCVAASGRRTGATSVASVASCPGPPPHRQRHLRDRHPRRRAAPPAARGRTPPPRRGRSAGSLAMALLEHRAQLVGHAVAAQVGDGLAGDPQELGDDLLALAPLEGGPTRDDREQGGGEAVDVRLPGGRAPVEHLGRAVGQRSGERARSGLEAALDAGDAEVGELGLAVVGEQDVRGLDVAVQGADAVRALQSARPAGPPAGWPPATGSGPRDAPARRANPATGTASRCRAVRCG